MTSHLGCGSEGDMVGGPGWDDTSSVVFIVIVLFIVFCVVRCGE